MPTGRKLPSGSYRCLIFSGYEYVDGAKKRRYESFTAPTKREAERLATEWADTRSTRTDITVGNAVNAYIDTRKGVLSPSTIRGYKACVKRFEPIANLRLRDLKNTNVQPWVSKMSEKLKYKSVKNTYGLLTAVLKYYYPGKTLQIKLPPRTKPQYDLPSDEDIQKLLEATKGTEMWTAIVLARFYSLRRSEICALTEDDLSGDVLTIRKAMVMDEDASWIIKNVPKTYGSYRQIKISEPLLSVLKKDGFPVCNPNNITDRFSDILRRNHIKEFNFHLLRHMFATKAAMMGIPDFIVARIGGWEQNSSVLKNIYQNVRDEDMQKQMDILNGQMMKELKI